MLAPLSIPASNHVLAAAVPCRRCHQFYWYRAGLISVPTNWNWALQLALSSSCAPCLLVPDSTLGQVADVLVPPGLAAVVGAASAAIGRLSVTAWSLPGRPGMPRKPESPRCGSPLRSFCSSKLNAFFFRFMEACLCLYDREPLP